MIIAVSFALHDPAAADGFSFSAGMDFTQGKYGGTTTTDIWYVPFTARYRTGRTSVRVTVPYLNITGPGNVLGPGLVDIIDSRIGFNGGDIASIGTGDVGGGGGGVFICNELAVNTLSNSSLCPNNQPDSNDGNPDVGSGSDEGNSGSDDGRSGPGNGNSGPNDDDDNSGPDDDDDDNNSGSGNDDNSGPGSDDGNSGSGSDDDNSGPSNGDNNSGSDDDDNSGPGSDDGNSGSGSDDDSSGSNDDDNNSGSGNDDNSGPGSDDGNSGSGSDDDNSGPGSADDNSGPGNDDTISASEVDKALQSVSSEEPVDAILDPNNEADAIDVDAISRRTASGLGDIVAALTYNLIDHKPSRIAFDITGRVKFPTASASQRLGSGEFDYAVQGDLFKSIAKFSLRTTFGYKMLGDPQGVNLQNVFYGGAGVGYRVLSNATMGTSFNISQSALRLQDSRALSVYYSHRFGSHFRLNFYGLKGFSDRSPNWGSGITLLYAF